MLYKIKARYVAPDGSGVLVRKVGNYIVEADSVMDAEAKLRGDGYFQDYSTESITKPMVSQVIDGDEDFYFRCKIVSVPDTDAQRCSAHFLIVNAADFDHAVAQAKRWAKDFAHTLESVTLTNIDGYVG